MNLKTKAKGYFESYKGIDELFFTIDGMAFFRSSDAEAHAKDIGNPSVVRVTRRESEGPELDQEPEVPENQDPEVPQNQEPEEQDDKPRKKGKK